MHLTLLVSAGLLLLGAVAALRLPRVMECGHGGAQRPAAPGIPAPREHALAAGRRVALSTLPASAHPLPPRSSFVGEAQ